MSKDDLVSKVNFLNEVEKIPFFKKALVSINFLVERSLLSLIENEEILSIKLLLRYLIKSYSFCPDLVKNAYNKL